MAVPTRSQVTGLVLAGGRGVRMGGLGKGWVVYEGQSLVHAKMKRLSPRVRAVLISANRNIDAFRSLAAVVTDADAGVALEPFPGPLAGVLSDLRHAATPWVAVVPCDSPALPDDLVERLAAGLDRASAEAAYANAGGRAQPVSSLVPCTAPASLQSLLDGGGRAIGWLTTLGAVPVESEDANGFRNINAIPGAQPIAEHRPA